MISLYAPYPAIATVSFLPNPTFGDSNSLVQSLDMSHAMTGKVRTYVKTGSESKLNYTFQLTRMKSLELKAFILKYYTSTIRLVNHKGEIWIVKLISNPFEFDSLNRIDPGREFVGITLQFQGTKQ